MSSHSLAGIQLLKWSLYTNTFSTEELGAFQAAVDQVIEVSSSAIFCPDAGEIKRKTRARCCHWLLFGTLSKCFQKNLMSLGWELAHGHKKNVSEGYNHICWNCKIQLCFYHSVWFLRLIWNKAVWSFGSCIISSKARHLSFPGVLTRCPLFIFNIISSIIFTYVYSNMNWGRPKSKPSAWGSTDWALSNWLTWWLPAELLSAHALRKSRHKTAERLTRGHLLTTQQPLQNQPHTEGSELHRKMCEHLF